MRHVALLAVLVVLASVVPSAAAAAAVEPTAPLATADRPTDAVDSAPRAIASRTDSMSPRVASSVGAPGTNFTVSLRENGSARWTVETRIPLDDESDRDAFREYARSYEAGDAEGGPTVDQFRNAAAAASEATGREMSIRRVNRTATLTNGSGVLRLRFTWVGFLEPGDEGVLALGDAFRTPNNGTWFGSLSGNQRLVIEPPADYEVSDVSQGFSYSISDRRIVAEGPQRFEAGDIAVRYEPGNQPPPDQSYPFELLAGAGAVLLFAVVVLMYRRESAVTDGADGTADAAAGTEPTADGSHRAESEAASGTHDGASTGAGLDRSEDHGELPGGGAGIDATAADDAGGEPEEDLELLSDEERVERLLETHDGRMRQGTIVEETGWSDAKVSQLLSAMADGGRIEKLRLGRENLISLSDSDGGGGEAIDDSAADGGSAPDDAS